MNFLKPIGRDQKTRDLNDSFFTYFLQTNKNYKKYYTLRVMILF